MGDDVTSVTEHVFYVKSDVKSVWETALSKLGDITPVDASTTVKDVAEPTELHKKKIKAEITAP